MEEIIYGELTYKRKKYSFSFINNELTLIPKKMRIQPFEVLFIEDDEKDMRNIEGTTSNGCYIVFINVVLCKNISGYYKAFVPAYAICRHFGLKVKLDKIEKMFFSGKALDLFFPPKNIVDKKRTNDKLIIEIDKTKHFVKKINLNKDVMELYTLWKTNETSNINEVLTVKSGINIIFDKTQNINGIVKYYRNIRKLFAILNNRKYIKWTEIGLDKKIINNDGKSVIVRFNLYIADNNKIETDMPEYFFSITYDDIKLNLPYLYKISSNEDFNINFLPDNKKEFNTIDDVKYMSLSENFEFQFKKLFPNYKSSQNEIFKNTKIEILDFIESNINNKEYCSKKEKERNEKYFKHFKKVIENDEGRLEEKILYVFKKYNQILIKSKNILLKQYNINVTDAKLAESFSKRRNNIAHGEYTGPYTDSEIVSFILLRICLYCIIFERSNFSENEIKKIIGKMFN